MKVKTLLAICVGVLALCVAWKICDAALTAYFENLTNSLFSAF